MKKQVKKYLFPGIGIAASAYSSSVFAAGAIAGFSAAELFMRIFIGTGRVKLMKFNYKDWEIHLHHWVWPSIIIAGAGALSTVSVIPLFLLGFLNGLIFHDIYTHNKWKDDDKRWYNVIYKKTAA